MTFEMRLEEARRYGMEQGLEKGLKQGLEKGLKQGLEQGLEQGRAEGQLMIQSIIKTMQQQGLSQEQIVKYAGISEEEVEKVLKAIE